MSTQEAWPAPSCRKVGQWLREHLGASALAPLTGQDTRALHAFTHALQLYTCADRDGRRAAIGALRWLLKAMQPSVRGLARDAIPMVIDSRDQATVLWFEISMSPEGGA